MLPLNNVCVRRALIPIALASGGLPVNTAAFQPLKLLAQLRPNV